MKNESTGLLQDIRDNPGDDLPRLVFADWLDDHGESTWAEFIRLQIVMSGGKIELPGFEDWDTCYKRIQALVNNRGYNPWEIRIKDVSIGYERGFAGCVRCTWAQWVEHGQYLVSIAPITLVIISDLMINMVPSLSDPQTIERWQLDGLYVPKVLVPYTMSIGAKLELDDLRSEVSKACLQWAKDAALGQEQGGAIVGLSREMITGG